MTAETANALQSLSDYYRRVNARRDGHVTRDLLTAVQVLAMIEETLNPNSDQWV